MKKAPAPEPHPVRPLLRVIEKSAALHEALELLIRRKLRLMKAGDVVGLRELGDQEHEIVDCIRENEGLRRQAAENAGKKLGMSVDRSRRTTLAQWTQRAESELAIEMSQAAIRLRKAVIGVSAVNRIAGDAAKTTVGHLHALGRFEDARDSQGSAYDRIGCVRAAARTMIFEAVG